MNNTTIDPQVLKLAREFLSKLGFGVEETRLYIALVENGPLTLLDASRKSGIERTKLYRSIDNLAEKGLIQEVPAYKHTTIEAADVSSLEMLVRQREVENKFLLDSLPTFAKAIGSFQNPYSGSHVTYYHGLEGIKQQTWHMLRCSEWPFRTYSCNFWSELFGERFSLRLNEELITHKFKVHDLYSDEYITYKENYARQFGKPPGNWSFWISRFISEKILTVHMNLDVYNDVIAYYYWQNNEIFGAEIYSERVAKFHKQMHDIVWKMAKPLGHFDWRKPAETWKPIK